MRVDSPEHVNELADRIEQALPDELRQVDRETLKRALMTLAHRLQPAPIEHRCKRLYAR